MLDTVSGTTYTTFLMADTVTVTRTRTLAWWGIALLVILGGFADLARGGETLAPILLAVGYCVLVPLAILK